MALSSPIAEKMNTPFFFEACLRSLAAKPPDFSGNGPLRSGKAVKARRSTGLTNLRRAGEITPRQGFVCKC